MSLPELATPIRIYWDLTPLPDSPPDLGKIAAEIIGLKILSVDISALGNSLPAACFAVLGRLAASGIGVSLTISPAALDAAVEDALTAAPPKELLLAVGSTSELDAILPLTPAVTGISFQLARSNWRQIPQLINCCAANGLKRLVFPMQRLYRGEKPFHMSGPERKAIAAALSACPPDAAMRITAHDPFVWRAIFPQTPFPEGRCQAANTMLAIDSSGIVYPCPVMPVALGDLATTPLKEIARGTTKNDLRSRLLRLPQACVNCSDAGGCKGGCRGRGEQFFGTWEGIDPGCK